MKDSIPSESFSKAKFTKRTYKKRLPKKNSNHSEVDDTNFNEDIKFEMVSKTVDNKFELRQNKKGKGGIKCTKNSSNVPLTVINTKNSSTAFDVDINEATKIAFAEFEVVLIDRNGSRYYVIDDIYQVVFEQLCSVKDFLKAIKDIYEINCIVAQLSEVMAVLKIKPELKPLGPRFTIASISSEEHLHNLYKYLKNLAKSDLKFDIKDLEGSYKQTPRNIKNCSNWQADSCPKDNVFSIYIISSEGSTNVVNCNIYKPQKDSHIASNAEKVGSNYQLCSIENKVNEQNKRKESIKSIEPCKPKHVKIKNQIIEKWSLSKSNELNDSEALPSEKEDKDTPELIEKLTTELLEDKKVRKLSDHEYEGHLKRFRREDVTYCDEPNADVIYLDTKKSEYDMETNEESCSSLNNEHHNTAKVETPKAPDCSIAEVILPSCSEKLLERNNPILQNNISWVGTKNPFYRDQYIHLNQTNVNELSHHKLIHRGKINDEIPATTNSETMLCSSKYNDINRLQASAINHRLVKSFIRPVYFVPSNHYLGKKAPQGEHSLSQEYNANLEAIPPFSQINSKAFVSYPPMEEYINQVPDSTCNFKNTALLYIKPEEESKFMNNIHGTHSDSPMDTVSRTSVFFSNAAYNKPAYYVNISAQRCANKKTIIHPFLSRSPRQHFLRGRYTDERINHLVQTSFPYQQRPVRCQPIHPMNASTPIEYKGMRFSDYNDKMQHKYENEIKLIVNHAKIWGEIAHKTYGNLIVNWFKEPTYHCIACLSCNNVFTPGGFMLHVDDPTLCNRPATSMTALQLNGLEKFDKEKISLWNKFCSDLQKLSDEGKIKGFMKNMPRLINDSDVIEQPT